MLTHTDMFYTTATPLRLRLSNGNKTEVLKSSHTTLHTTATEQSVSVSHNNNY